MSKKVYLVDGSGYIFRAYYAVPSLTNSAGFPTNALYGFVRMLLKLLKEADSEHVVMVFDAGKETFRNELYSEYKANRDECPEDLVKQMPYFREIGRALGLPILELAGYEADDIIGTLAKRFTKTKREVVIITGDKDLMQLVNDQVSIWDTMKDRRFNSAGVEEKMGVPPEKIVEFLGLTGDSSDNIPGLKGVGPKTAVQLIEKYGDVAQIAESADAIKEDKSIRNRKKISAAIELEGEILRLSRQLVEVECATPVKVEYKGAQVQLTELSDTALFEAMVKKGPQEELLRDLIARFEFASLFKDFNLGAPTKKQQQTEFSYHTIYKDDFAAWLKELSAQSEFSFDLETDSLDVLQANIIGFAFSWGDQEASYLPVGHLSSEKEQLDLDQVLEACAPIFTNPKIKKYGQNLKYDLSVLACHGVEVTGIAFDTMIASYLLNPDRNSHGLSALSQDLLNRNPIEYNEVVSDKPDFSHVDIPTATIYACEDAHYAWLLTQKLAPLIKEKKLTRVFDKIEIPLLSVLSKMERKGVRLDRENMEKMSLELGEKIALLEVELYKLAECEFNINSPKQVSDILFNKLGISTKGLKKTKTGAISTNAAVLERLSSEYEFPRRLLEYRELYKLKSTYVDALPAQISSVTGRLHTKFNQAVTATGRLSSSDPNLQNIPIQSEEGRKIRNLFIADEGNMLISADYSQIELRLLAHMSEDPNLLAAFTDGMDIHANTTREIMGLSEEETVNTELRRIGKTINFGIIYGMSGFRLARSLDLPVGVANQYINDYFAHYGKVKDYFARLEKQAEEEGFVTTLYGRRRNISEIDASGRDRGFLNRVAINAPLQGSAADIIKLAMVQIDTRIQAESLPLDMILQIHDELVFECPESFKEEAIKLIQGEMESVVELRVPLEVDIGWGKNWQEAH